MHKYGTTKLYKNENNHEREPTSLLFKQTWKTPQTNTYQSWWHQYVPLQGKQMTLCCLQCGSKMGFSDRPWCHHPADQTHSFPTCRADLLRKNSFISYFRHFFLIKKNNQLLDEYYFHDLQNVPTWLHILNI
jgi:hypothetical protein